MDPLAAKMSKSDQDSGILIHDGPEDIRRKIGKAFCPTEVIGNPVLEITRHILFERIDTFIVKRPEKFGGNLEFRNYADLEAAFLGGTLHPMDLKNNVAEALSDVLAPTRQYFVDHPENYEKVKDVIAQLKTLR
jgi:tyrosyl-tRNA synthetase